MGDSLRYWNPTARDVVARRLLELQAPEFTKGLMQNALITALATAALSAFVLLGASFSNAISQTATSLPNHDSPAVASHAQAAGTSALRGLAATSDATRRAVRSVRRRASPSFVKRDGLRPHGSSTNKIAAAYGISPFAVKAITTSKQARRSAAAKAFHRGRVVFEAADGAEHELFRPLTVRSDLKNTWALLDADNVFADFSRAFGDKSAQLTGLDRSGFPRNTSSYALEEYIEPVQHLLQSGAQLPASMRTFRDWLSARGELQTFLNEPSSSRAVFSLQHLYFVEQGLYREMRGLAGAREGIETLHQQWPIRVVTKRYGTGPDFAHVNSRVPADSTAWIARMLGENYDSVTVMGRDKADFAGNVHAVFEDSVSNIEKIRAANASSSLRERAFATGVKATELDNYLARHNVDVLGIAFRWNYNDGAKILEAPNVVAVDSWSDATAVALAYRRLLTDPSAGASGKLHWSEVPGLVNADGTAVKLTKAPIRAN